MMEEICWTTFRSDHRILKDQFRFQRSLTGVLSRTKDTVFTRKSPVSSHQQYGVAWDQAPQWRKKTKKQAETVKKYILACEAS